MGTRRVYELRFEKGVGDGVLMRSISVGDTESLPSMESAQTDGLRVKRFVVAEAHRTMLGALYHVPPKLGTTWSEESRAALREFGLTMTY